MDRQCNAQYVYLFRKPFLKSFITVGAEALWKQSCTVQSLWCNSTELKKVQCLSCQPRSRESILHFNVSLLLLLSTRLTGMVLMAIIICTGMAVLALIVALFHIAYKNIWFNIPRPSQSWWTLAYLNAIYNDIKQKHCLLCLIYNYSTTWAKQTSKLSQVTCAWVTHRHPSCLLVQTLSRSVTPWQRNVLSPLNTDTKSDTSCISYNIV